MIQRSSARAVALVLLLVGPAAFAGCIGGPDEDGGAPVDELEDNSSQTNTTLPDGRAPSAGFEETNQTEDGIGGVEHKHDYWKGRTEVVVFDDMVEFFPEPVFPDGEGTDPKTVAYVKLPYGNLVYEGAEKVEVTIGAPLDPFFEGASSPIPPTVFMQYRTAASSEWGSPQAVTLDAPVEIPVTPLEADMPHSVQSLWVWRLTTDRPDWSSVPMTIKVYRGHDVVDWPGHPEFYAEKPWRVVMDDDVRTHMSGIQEGALYDGGGTWVTPSRLISHGTTRLEVFINVSSVEASNGAPYTGIFMEHHNATVIGPEIRFGERTSDLDGSEDLKAWNFTVMVDHEGMDGPYQPESRWGFRAMATFAQVGVPGVIGLGLCPGCFPYDINYHITVIAVNDDWAPPAPDEEE